MDAVDKAKRALSFHFLLKVMNLAMNVAVARVVSPAQFGQANINLLLLNTLILHFTRECFRRVAQRVPQNAVKIMWLGSLSTWLFAPLAWAFWPAADGVVTAVICLAAAVEAAAEPLYAEHLVSMEMKYRALAEGIALCLRGACILATVSYGLLAFSLGQLVYAVTVVSVYYLSSTQSPWLALKSPVEIETVGLLKAGFVIAMLKFLLSEGEKMVLMVFVVADSQQGVYALVASIGSIVTRNLFQPIEETTYGLFTKLKGSAEAIGVAKSLVKVMWVLGLGAVVYGNMLGEIFVKVLYGEQWLEAGAGTALRQYCVYILLMALYGVVDAIGFAQSSPADLRTREGAMVGFSLVYITSSVFLVNYGAAGIIASNAFSYICRLVYAVRLLRIQMPKLVWSDLLPELWTAASFAVVYSLSGLGPVAAFALLPQAVLLWKQNRQFVLKAKQE